MRAIKAIVIFMGILLIAGLGLIGYGLYSKASKLSKKPADQIAATAPTAPSGGISLPPGAVLEGDAAATGNFGTQTVTLPPGSRVEGVSSAANRVVVHVTGPEGSRLIMLNPVSGAVSGTLLLKPEAAAGGGTPQ